MFPTHVMVADLSFENQNNFWKKSLNDSIKMNLHNNNLFLVFFFDDLLINHLYKVLSIKHLFSFSIFLFIKRKEQD